MLTMPAALAVLAALNGAAAGANDRDGPVAVELVAVAPRGSSVLEPPRCSTVLDDGVVLDVSVIDGVEGAKAPSGNAIARSAASPGANRYPVSSTTVVGPASSTNSTIPELRTGRVMRARRRRPRRATAGVRRARLRRSGPATADSDITPTELRRGRRPGARRYHGAATQRRGACRLLQPRMRCRNADRRRHARPSQHAPWSPVHRVTNAASQ